jgi:hypothetical protein
VTARHRAQLPAGGAVSTVSRLEVTLWSALALGSALALAWGWRWAVTANDYGLEAAPSMTALLHGHISEFLQSAPSYGASLALRAPFALPGSLAGGGALLIYRLGALPCLLAIGALGVWCAVNLRRAGARLAAAGLAVLVCAANPITYRALQTGHPEELLGGALCVAAVLLAQRGRANLAAVALGLAIANKEWALLAIGPVLLALPAHRWRSLIIAGVLASALVAPMFLSSPSVTSGTDRIVVTATGGIFHPWQICWFVGPRGHWVPAMLGSVARGFRDAPAWLGGRAHILIVWLGLPLTLLAVRRRTPRADALLLLALLLLLRCWLDPWDVVYYPLPFIFALLAWETTVAHRAPWGAAAATAATWLIFWYLPGHIGVDAQAVSFLLPATLTLAVLAAVVYRLRPLRSAQRAHPRLSRAPAVPS